MAKTKKEKALKKEVQVKEEKRLSAIENYIKYKGGK